MLTQPDQEQEPDRAQQQPEVIDGLLRNKIILQRLDAGLPFRVRLRKLFGELPGNRLHLGVGLLKRDALFQTPHHPQPVILVVDLFRLEGQRQH